MKELDTYIIEKLKLSKDTKGDKELSLENMSVLETIALDILEVVKGQELFKIISEWILDNDVTNFFCTCTETFYSVLPGVVEKYITILSPTDMKYVVMNLEKDKSHKILYLKKSYEIDTIGGANGGDKPASLMFYDFDSCTYPIIFTKK